MGGRGSGPSVLRPALEMPEVGLDGHLPLVQPLPHVVVLQDELPHLFQDDHVGAEKEAVRGEHTLQEKFGERSPIPRASLPAPPRPGCCPPCGLGCEEGLP